MTRPLITLKGAAGDGMFAPDEVRELIAKAAEDFPHLSHDTAAFQKAMVATAQAPPDKAWTKCSAIEKQALISRSPDKYPFGVRRAIVKELMRQFPTQAGRITKSMMPTPVSYEEHRTAVFDDALEDASLHTKPWAHCTAVEKAVLLEEQPAGRFPQERTRVAAELTKQFPESAEQIRKELMPTPAPVRRTAHPGRPLSAPSARYVADVFAEVTEQRQALAKAFAAGEENARAAAVTKASKAKSDQVAVYDADGNLVGVTDPDSITPVAAAQSPEKPKAEAPPKDATPAAPAAATAPAAEVTKAQVQQMSAELKKALVDGGRTGSAAESARIGEAMNRALITKFEDMQRRGLAPGQPRTR